jgi:hypothetical protein
LAALVAVAPAVLVASVAWAFFTSGGSGSGSAPVARLAAPTAVVGTATGADVAVRWTGIVAPGSGTVGYYVTRTAVPSGTPVAACGSPASPLPAAPTSCTDSPVAAGTSSYAVTAVFRTWTSASAPSDPVVVGRAVSTTSLALSAPNTVYGAEAAVTVTVAVGGDVPFTPTGTVTVTSGGAVLCTLTLPASTCAPAATALAASGVAHTVTASYGGDAEFTGSTAPVRDLLVTPDTTTTTAAAVPGTVTVGYEDTSTLTASVATGNGEDLPATGEQVTIAVGTASCLADLIPGGSGGRGSCTLGASALAPDQTPYAVATTYIGDTDLAGSSSAAAGGLTVAAAPVVTTTAVADATRTQTGYFQILTVDGGSPPMVWSVTAGVLPAGLSLDPASGAISGDVDPAAVTEGFTVRADDRSGAWAEATVTLTVDDAPVITTTSLAPAKGAEAGYSQALAATGGAPPLSWAVTQGALPVGLDLDPSTGIISGNVDPATTSHTFTVSVTDANGVSALRVLTIVVNLPFVQQMTIPRAGGNHSSFAAVLSGPVAAGDTLVLSLAQPCATAAGTPVASPVTGATWDGTDFAVAVATGCTANGDAELWDLVDTGSASGSAATTVTVTLAAPATVPFLSVAEYTGVTGSDTAPAAGSSSSGSSATVDPGPATPSAPGELVVSTGFVNRATLGTLSTQLAPFVLLNQTTPYQGFGSYLVDPATSPRGFTYTQSAPGPWSAAICTFALAP